MLVGVPGEEIAADRRDQLRDAVPESTDFSRIASVAQDSRGAEAMDVGEIARRAGRLFGERETGRQVGMAGQLFMFLSLPRKIPVAP